MTERQGTKFTSLILGLSILLNIRLRAPSFASVFGAIGVGALFLFPGSWLAGSHTFEGFPVASFAGLSAATMGLLSALLWAHASREPNGEFGNAVAAGCSGATAAFGVGSIPVTREMTEFHPDITAHLPHIGYAFGWIIALSILATVLFRRD